MEHLVRDFKVKEIFFVGSTFSANREKTMELCNLIRERNLKVAWTVSTRVDTLDRELLKNMKDAGCWSIRVGIESGNEDVLKFINKKITKEQVRKTLEDCEAVGMHVKAFFMLGHLTETKESIEDTINFALSLPLADVTVQLNTPLPNTRQFELANEYGTFDSQDFSKFNFFTPVFVPKGLTAEYLEKKQKEFYRRFYLRWPTIKRHIAKLREGETRSNYLRAIPLFLYLTFLKRFKGEGRGPQWHEMSDTSSG